MIDAIGRLVRTPRAGRGYVEARFGDIARRGGAAALICDHIQAVAFACEPQDRLDKILAKRAVDPRRAQDDVPRIGEADAVLARELAAAIGIERRHRISFDIGRALASVEHVISRDVNERNTATAGLDRKSRRRVGVHGERSRFFTFGTIDIGIGGGVDDGAPRLSRDHPDNRLRIF